MSFLFDIQSSATRIVLFRWTFNPAVLTKVSSPLLGGDGVGGVLGAVGGSPPSPRGGGGSSEAAQTQFSVGDLVQISSDIERMKILQAPLID